MDNHICRLNNYKTYIFPKQIDKQKGQQYTSNFIFIRNRERIFPIRSKYNMYFPSRWIDKMVNHIYVNYNSVRNQSNGCHNLLNTLVKNVSFKLILLFSSYSHTNHLMLGMISNKTTNKSVIEYLSDSKGIYCNKYLLTECMRPFRALQELSEVRCLRRNS